MSDLAELKAALPAYLERSGIRIARRTEQRLSALCPLHQDTRPSFRAAWKNGVWLWRCDVCNVGGTVIDLHAALHGLQPRDGEAIREAARVAGVPLPGQRPPSPAERRRQREARIARHDEEAKARHRQERQRQLTATLLAKRAAMLSPYRSDRWAADLRHASPLAIPAQTHEQARLIVTRLFAPGDILWLGDVKDSGKLRHLSNFRPAREWAEMERLPSRIAAGTFQRGTISRSDSRIQRRPFLIIESDDLIGHKPTTPEERDANRRESAGLFSFLRQELHMTLRAVVDTGGKSLHGWFDRPSDRATAGLARLADGLSIDAAVFRQSANSPLRLPGCIHHATGTPATLLYLHPISNS